MENKLNKQMPKDILPIKAMKYGYFSHHFYMTPAPIAKLRNISKTQENIIGAVCSMMLHGNIFYKTNKAMAKEFGRSKRSIVYAIKSLVKHGYLSSYYNSEHNRRVLYLSKSNWNTLGMSNKNALPNVVKVTNSADVMLQEKNKVIASLKSKLSSQSSATSTSSSASSNSIIDVASYSVISTSSDVSNLSESTSSLDSSLPSASDFANSSSSESSVSSASSSEDYMSAWYASESSIAEKLSSDANVTAEQIQLVNGVVTSTTPANHSSEHNPDVMATAKYNYFPIQDSCLSTMKHQLKNHSCVEISNDEVSLVNSIITPSTLNKSNQVSNQTDTDKFMNTYVINLTDNQFKKTFKNYTLVVQAILWGIKRTYDLGFGTAMAIKVGKSLTYDFNFEHQGLCGLTSPLTKTNVKELNKAINEVTKDMVNPIKAIINKYNLLTKAVNA